MLLNCLWQKFSSDFVFCGEFAKNIFWIFRVIFKAGVLSVSESLRMRFVVLSIKFCVCGRTVILCNVVIKRVAEC